jgi:hypothetical protein
LSTWNRSVGVHMSQAQAARDASLVTPKEAARVRAQAWQGEQKEAGLNLLMAACYGHVYADGL